jgi:hypothetical protein
VNTDADPVFTPGIVPEDITRPNGDVLGNSCDTDDDNDGLADTQEAAGCNGSGMLNPLNADTDGDRTIDGAECFLGTNPGNANSKPVTLHPVALDPDRDGLLADVEAALGTDPNVSDTDGDGLHDGLEFRGYGTSPLDSNTDDDACTDASEMASVNTDLIVSSVDLFLIAQRFAQVDSPNFDLNKDGVISSVDLQLAAVNFGDDGCVS